MKLKVVIIILLNFTLILNLSSQRVLTKNTGHSKEITSIEYSPDGKYLATFSKDNTIKIWNVETGQEIRTMQNFNASTFLNLKFTPPSENDLKGGKYLVSAGNGIKLWETVSGKCIRSTHYDSVITVCVDISNDGKYIVSGSLDINLWDAKTLKKIKTINDYNAEYGITNVKFSSNGSFIISGDYQGKLIIWDTKTGKKIKTLIGPRVYKVILDIDISKDDKYVVVSVAGDAIQVFDIKTGKKLFTFEISSNNLYEREVCFSNDNKYIATNEPNGDINIWNFKTKEKIICKDAKELNNGFSQNVITTIKFSPDGKTLVSGDTKGNIKFWDINSGRNLKSFKSNVSEIRNLIFNSFGINLISENNEIKKWRFDMNPDLTSLKLPSNYFLYYFSNISSSKNGQFIFFNCVDTSQMPESFSTIIYRYDLIKMEANWATFKDYEIRNFTVSDDGNIVFCSYLDGKIKSWNIETGQFAEFQSSPKFINNIDISPDQKTFVICADSSIIFRDINSGKILNHLKENHIIRNIKISPDNSIFITNGESNSIDIWDFKTKRKVRNLKYLQRWNYWDSDLFDFSPDGKYFLIASNLISLYDTKTTKQIKAFGGFEDIMSITFSENSKYIISGYNDGKIVVWETETGKLLISLVSLKNSNDYIVYTPDGRFDGTEKGMELLYYVEGMDIIPLSSLYEEFYTPNLLSRIMAGEEFKTPDININSLKLPPEVTILSPHTNTNSSTKEVKIDVKVKDLGGGIDEVRLYQNGKLIETTQKGFKTTERADEIKNISYSIQLNEGENIIKLTAFNNQRTESKPYKIKIKKTGPKKTSNLYMIIIGIDKYKNQQYNLNYATADATAIKKVIESNSTDIFNNVKIEFLTDENANKSNIQNKLNDLILTANQEDVFLFYYAGHGVMSIEEKPMYYIIPNDVVQMYGDNKNLQEKAISAEELKEFAMKLKAQKQLYIFDACQSGGMTTHIASRGAAEEKAIALLARSTGTYWLTASGSEQFATEFAQLGHGLYTYAILKGLGGEADSGKKDKQITVQELDVYIKNIVPELSKKYKGAYQFPKSYGGGDDFPIIILK